MDISICGTQMLRASSFTSDGALWVLSLLQCRALRSQYDLPVIVQSKKINVIPHVSVLDLWNQRVKAGMRYSGKKTTMTTVTHKASEGNVICFFWRHLQEAERKEPIFYICLGLSWRRQACGCQCTRKIQKKTGLMGWVHGMQWDAIHAMFAYQPAIRIAPIFSYTRFFTSA